MMSQISKFENLQKLKIQQTNITAKGLKELEGLQYIESLNLYGTSLDDSALKSLGPLKSLKSVFLWQTNMTKEEVNSFAEAHPLIDVNFEVDHNIFGDAKLKPPLITADTDIFEDSIRSNHEHQL